MKEIWKEIQNFEGYYRISNCGNVFSIKSNKIRKGYVNNSGYEVIHLYKDGKDHIFTVHRLVALTFVPNPYNYKEINHINRNKLCNNADNLEWCSRKYNQEYSGNIAKWAKSGAMANKIKSSKPVFQYTLDGVFVRGWNSAREAESELCISRQSIGKCCLGKYKQSGGFCWSFNEECDRMANGEYKKIKGVLTTL